MQNSPVAPMPAAPASPGEALDHLVCEASLLFDFVRKLRPEADAAIHAVLRDWQKAERH